MDSHWILIAAGVLLLAFNPSGFTGVNGAAIPPNTTAPAVPEAVIPTAKDGEENVLDTKETEPVKPKDPEPVKPTSSSPVVNPGEALDGPTALAAAEPKPESGDDAAPETEVTTGSEEPTEALVVPNTASAKGNQSSKGSAKNESVDDSKPVAIATDDAKVTTEDNVPSEVPSVEPKVEPIAEVPASTGDDVLIQKNDTDVSSTKNTTKPAVIVVPTEKGDLVNGGGKGVTEDVTEGAVVQNEGNKTEGIAQPPNPPVAVTSSLPTTTTTPPPPTTTTSPTTTTTSPTTTTTPVPPVDVVTKVTTPISVTVVPSVPAVDTDPPYVVATTTTAPPSPATNGSLIGANTANEKKTFSPKLIAIIVGSAVGLIVVIVIIVVVIVCTRKKRYSVKKREIPIVENPRYQSANSQQGHNYRFSRDASLMIGAPHLANNNLNKEGDMNSLRKKRRAPPPPNPFTGEVDAFRIPIRQDSVEYYEKFGKGKKQKAPPPPNPFTGEIDALSNPYSLEYFEQLSRNKKRMAPPPPNPFTGEVDAYSNPNSIEYFGQDTPHGSEVELTTFGVKQPQQADDRKANAPAQPTSAAAAEETAQTDFSDTDDDDGHRSMEELEGQALLDDIERETGYKIAAGPAGNRKSVADKYRFSDDEEARESSRDYDRKYPMGDDRFSSEEELDKGGLHYDVNDITAELPPTPEGSGDEGGYSKAKNPFES